MIRICLFLFLALVVYASFGQQIPRHEADSIMKVLVVTTTPRERIPLLLHLARFHIMTPGEAVKDLDSAAALIGEARRLNARLDPAEPSGYILLLESYLANESRDGAKWRRLLDESIQQLAKEKNFYRLGEAYMTLAYSYNLEDATQVPDRMRSFKAAIAAFKSGGNIEQEARAYERLAETDSSDVTTEEELHQALALYESIHYPEVQGVYDLFASLFIFRSDFAEALKWGLKALKTAEAVGDSTMQLSTINNHIAIIYSHSRDSANAVKYYGEALRIAQKYDDRPTIYVLAHNISNIYMTLHLPERAREVLEPIQKKYGAPEKKDMVNYQRYICDLVQLYTLSKEYQRAEPYAQELIDVEHAYPYNAEALSDLYVALLDYFHASGQFNRMPEYLKKDEAAATRYKNPRNMTKLHTLWFRYDTARHDYQSAVTHLLEAYQWNTTYNNNARDRMLKELQVQFETQKKEDQIVVLNQQAQLEKASARQATLAKNITIAGIIAVFAIAMLLYRQNRAKQRNNNVITRQNGQLQRLVTEKEWLLKEIHHRVKNNLQIVMSLLYSQSESIDNEPARMAIHDSQHRVQAMSLIHQKLYNSDNVSSINMSLYIGELAIYLAESFGTGHRIRMYHEIENIELDVSQAVPLGLILNEAITNSIKYGFPGEKNGEVFISLKDIGTHYLLCISDNGVGMPLSTVDKKAGSLGMTLMEGLTGDLQGSCQFDSAPGMGTIVRILFPHKPVLKQQADVIYTPKEIFQNAF